MHHARNLTSDCNPTASDFERRLDWLKDESDRLFNRVSVPLLGFTLTIIALSIAIA